MQQYDPERNFRRAMRRTDIARGVIAGILLAVCLIVSAYVSLAMGLWTGIAAFILLAVFWSYSHKRRQQPIADAVTLPALAQVFDQPTFSLPASLTENEVGALFPGAVKVRCRNQVTASWHGMTFSFANVLVRGAERAVLFHGQYLVAHTDWPLPGRVDICERTEPVTAALDAETTLPAVDSAFLRAYRVDTDAPRKASCILSCHLLQTMLLQNPGAHLRVEGSTVRLAIPSGEPFFELTGLEESAAQVRSASQRQIMILQSWLDGLLAVEMPEA